MIFELTHENITLALKEYMDKRNILNGRNFTFKMKTSRKGEKTSRAIIETIDLIIPVSPPEVPVAPSQEEPPLHEEVPSAFVSPPATEDMATEAEAVEGKSTPFKKLFA